MSKKKFSGSISGKGYYIALILCAVAIGISGYLYYRNTTKQEQSLQAQQAASQKKDEDVQAVATQPDTDTQKTPEKQNPSDTQEEPSGKPAKTTRPVTGEVVVQYSMDALCYNQTTRDWRVHNGVDYAAETGTQVCAAADGTVNAVYADETMGMTVVIDHSGGYKTTYSSLADTVNVSVGDTVRMGQAIGTAGRTALLETALGEHVHFSVSCDGKLIDPAQFLAAE